MSRADDEIRTRDPHLGKVERTFATWGHPRTEAYTAGLLASTRSFSEPPKDRRGLPLAPVRLRDLGRGLGPPRTSGYASPGGKEIKIKRNAGHVIGGRQVAKLKNGTFGL